MRTLYRQALPFSYPEEFTVYINCQGYKIEKNGKLLGIAKSATEAKQIIEANK